ncbi:MAG: hypothetical protein RAO92_01320 [Candidatus Euphemobacter frigidus]|nr:hypothetical protein [Candidatus Euphemobacter frigidus]MDP8275020.1 hypothetical protein [Candidatus Euphemobacter frigidus]
MNGNRITIKGIVNAADWEDDGSIIRVAILTSDDEEYLVADNEMGRELLDFESEGVKATGVVSESEYGEKTIILSSYNVIEYEPSVEEEEDFLD